MNIENLLKIIQQIDLLNSLKNDISFGQLPDYMMQDRSVKQGDVKQDNLFDNQGSIEYINNLNKNTSNKIELDEINKPIQENIPVSFSDFFNNPKYFYEHSVMVPKKDDIDD